MWLSRQRGGTRRGEAPSEEGTVTCGGVPAGVYLEGERREVPVFAPGGYCWRPGEGDRVLVLKAGGEGEQPCVVGSRVQDRELAPGEVAIRTGSSEIRLSRDGGLALSGTVSVNGTELESWIRQIAASMMG